MQAMAQALAEKNKTEGRTAPEKRSRRHRRRRLETTALGAAVLGLAAVGLCVLVVAAAQSVVGYVKAYLGPAETPDYFETYLMPVVIQDPAPFKSVKSLDPAWLMKTAILAAVSQQSDTEQYAFTKDGSREIVPREDVAKSFKSLFGSAADPKFTTFTSRGETFEYDFRKTCYYVPMIAYYNTYTPEVRSIVRQGDTLRLLVNYVPGEELAQTSGGSTTALHAAKTMIYTLRGARGTYAIVSVRKAKTSQAGSSGPVSVVSGASSGGTNQFD